MSVKFTKKGIIKLLLILSIIICIGIVLIINSNNKNHINVDFEDKLSNIILQENSEKYLKGAYSCESHHIFTTALNNEENVKAYYILYSYYEYNYDNNKLEIIGGGCSPAVITFRLDAQEESDLYEYWEPRSGELFYSDMSKKFPSDINFNDADLSKKLDSECNHKAENYFKCK